MQKLDLKTLEAVQLTAPGASQADADSLYGRVKSGELFKSFDERHRDEIWRRLCLATEDFLVPSLFAFFENWKYLKGPADCMRRLIHLGRGETIQAALDNAFRNTNHGTQDCAIQLSRLAFKYVSLDLAGRFDTMYRQLWLFAIREYMDMPADSNRKLAIPGGSQVNECVLFEFASLAHKLGVESEQIKKMLERDPDREVARRLLITARKPERYRYQDLESLITQVVSLISSAQPLPSEQENEEEIEERPRLPKRSGIPNKIDQLRDKSYMFLPRLHAPMERKRTLDSFFIQRSMYFAFFGKQTAVNLQTSSDLDGDTEMIHLDQVSSQTGKIQFEGRAEYQRLEERHHNLQQMVQHLQNEMTEEKEKLRKISLEEQTLETKLNKMKQEEIEQATRLDKLKAEEQEHLARLERLKLDQQSQESINQTADDKRHQITREEGNLQTRVNKLSEQESRLLLSLKKLKAEERKIRDETDKHKFEIERLRQEESTCQSAVQQLVQERDESASQVEKLKEDISQLEKEQKDRELHIEQLMSKEREYQSTVDRLIPNNMFTRPGAALTGRVRVNFVVKLEQVLVDPSDPSNLEDAARGYLRQESGLFDCRERQLHVDGIFDKLTQSGENNVYVVRDWQVERKRNNKRGRNLTDETKRILK